MNHAALYIRVSTEEQTEYSPQAQYDELMTYAQEHHLTVLPQHVFTDSGISGRNASKRPAFLSMMKLSKTKPRPFDVVLVHKYDRFARNKQDSVLYKALLKKANIQLISIREPIPSDDKFAVIYESMLEAMAEYYSLNLAEEVKKTMIKKAMQGEHQSIAPYGYQNENKTFVILPEEAKIVQHIYHLYYYQNKPFLHITKEINAMGARTHRGNTFDTRGVQYILTNPVYAGFARWTPSEKRKRGSDHPDTLIVPSNHAPIISHELFQEVQKKINTRKKSTQKLLSQQKKIHTWLTGCLFCSNCHAPLVVSSKYKSGSTQLQCGNYNHGRCSLSHSISSQKIEKAVITTFHDTIIPTQNLSYHVSYEKKGGGLEKITQLKMQYRQLQLKLERAKEAYLNSIDTMEEYVKNKNYLHTQLNQIHTQIQREAQQESITSDNTSITFPHIGKILSDEQFSSAQKKAVADAVFEKIVYVKGNNSIELYLNISIS